MDMTDLDELPDCFYPMVIMEPVLIFRTRYKDGIKIVSNAELYPYDGEVTIIRIPDEI